MLLYKITEHVEQRPLWQKIPHVLPLAISTVFVSKLSSVKIPRILVKNSRKINVLKR